MEQIFITTINKEYINELFFIDLNDKQCIANIDNLKKLHNAIEKKLIKIYKYKYNEKEYNKIYLKTKNNTILSNYNVCLDNDKFNQLIFNINKNNVLIKDNFLLLNLNINTFNQEQLNVSVKLNFINNFGKNEYINNILSIKPKKDK